MLLSWNIYSKRGRWKTALSPTEQGQKAALQRKIPLVGKSYSLNLQVILQKGVMVSMKMMMIEKQSS
jgi:hypothetical protein